MKKIYVSIALLLGSAFYVNSQTLVKEINATGISGVNGCQPGEVVKINNVVLFRANDDLPSAPNFELWKTEGTTASTVKVAEINTGGSSFPANSVAINNVLFFAASNGVSVNGNELWRYDPSSGTPTMVKDIYTGASGSNPEGFTQFGTTSTFYFKAQDAQGFELWKSDGTYGGTVRVSDIYPGPTSSNPSSFAYLNNWIYFAADNGTNGTELWRTNGTTTVMVRDINPSGGSFPANIIAYNNAIYFTADDGSNGIELWKSDGTTGGTQIVKNINTTSGQGSSPSNFTVAANTLFFTADDGATGVELYKTDGKSAGTILIDVATGATSSNPSNLTQVGSLLFFAAFRSDVGNEVFYYDNTGSGSLTAINVESGASGSSPQEFENAYGYLYFSAQTAAHGREVWRWTSTTGAQRQTDLANGTLSSDPRDFKVIGTDLVFFADNGSIGTELYKLSLPNAPTISAIANQTTPEDVPIANIPITINSAVSPLANLTLSGSSSNTSLISSSGFVFGGSGSNRTLTLTPNTFQNGSAIITITVCDNSNNCVSTNFNLTVTDVPNAPVLTDFAVTFNEDNIYSFTLGQFQANFFDPENDPMDSIRIEILPTNGVLFYGTDTITAVPHKITASLVSTLKFKPNTNWNGTTTFNWGGKGGGMWANASKTVTLNVNAVNDVPVIVQPPAVTAIEDVVFTFMSSQFSNASVYFDVEGQPLASIQITGLTTRGKLLNNGDTLTAIDLPKIITEANIANLTYVPNSNLNGSDYFLYKAGDGVGYSATDTFKINVTAVNDAPIAQSFNVTATEDVVYNMQKVNFQNFGYSDVEGTPINSVRFDVLPKRGTLKYKGNNVTAGQVFKLASIDTVSYQPNLNFYGNDTVKFSVRDNALFSTATANYIITVNPVNDLPVADLVTKNGAEDATISFTTLEFKNAYSDIEADTFKGISISSLPANGKLYVANELIAANNLPRNITFDSVSKFTFVPDLNWNGSTHFRYRAYDGFGYSQVSDTVRITISPVNDAPVVYNFPGSISEDDTLRFFIKDFTDNFTDVDGDSIIHLQITQLPVNGVLLVNGIPVNAVPFNISKPILNVVDYVPNANYTGSDLIRFKGFDGALYSANTANINLSVDPINDAPFAATINKDGNEDELVNILTSDFLPVYSDVENDPFSRLKIMSLPANGTLRLNNTPVGVNNILNVGAIANLVFAPNANYTGQTYFLFQVGDAQLFSTQTDTFYMDILPVNDKPVVTAPTSKTLTEDEVGAIAGISFADVDLPTNAIAQVSLTSQNGTLTLTNTTGINFITGDGSNDKNIVFEGTLAQLNASIGSLNYLSDLDYNGFDLVRVIFNDNGNLGSGGAKSDTAQISIEVTGVNDTVIISTPNNLSVLENTNLLINNVSLGDVDGDNSNVRVTLSTVNGTLTLGGTALLTFVNGDGTSDSTMSFFGPLTAINPALSAITYKSNFGYVGGDFINISVSDSNTLSQVATDNAVIFLTVNPRPITFSNHPISTNICESGNATFTVAVGGTTPYQYQWLKNGVDMVGETESTLNLTGIDTSDASVYACRVTNPAGSLNSNNATLVVYDKPNADFSFSEACKGLPIQFGDSTILVGDTIKSFNWAMGDGTSFTNQHPTHTYANTNPYNARLIVESGFGCKDTLVKQVQVYATPIPSFTATPGCKGESTIFTNNSTLSFGTPNYLWDFGNGDSSNLHTPNHTYASEGTYNVTLYIDNGGKCLQSSSQTVTVNPNPVVGFSFSDQCRVDAAEFTNNSSIVTGSNAYLWQFGDGTTSSNVSPSKNYATAGTYLVKLKATSDKGCKDSLTQAIVIYPKPTPQFSVQSVCDIDSASFINSSTVSSGTLSYLWIYGDGETSTSSTHKHFYQNIGTYTAKLIATGDFGCKDSTTRTLEIRATPNAMFSVADVCNPDAANFINATTLEAGTNSYNWTFGDGTTSANVSPTKTFANAGTYQVKLLATSDKGCIDSASQSLIVYPKPVASYTVQSICDIDTAMFMNTSTVSSGILNYNWSFGNGITSTENSPAYFYPIYGTYTTKLVVTGDFGCKDSVTKVVDIKSTPIANFSFNDLCMPEAANFQNLSTLASGSPTYSWNFGDGTNSSNVSPSKVYANPGTYQVSLLSTSEKGCTDSITQTITIYAKPTAQFTVQNICDVDTASFVNFSTISAGALNYSWNYGNGQTSTETSPNYFYPNYGIYNAKLVVTGDFGCKDSVTKVVEIKSTPVANFSFNDLCMPEAANFQNLSTLASGSPTYTWNFGDGTNSSNVSPLKVYTNPGTYQVSLLSTSEKGCTDSITQTITIYAKPTAQFTVQNICDVDTASFVNFSTISAGALNYSWNYGNGQTSTETSPNYFYPNYGSYNAKLVVTGDFGCKDSVTKTINVHPTPQAGFTFQNVCDGESINFNNTSIIENGLNSYTWNYGDGTSSNNVSPIKTYNNDGNYTVKLFVVSDQLCADSSIQLVRVFPQPQVNFSVDNECLVDSVQFQNQSLVSNGGYLAYWKFSNSLRDTVTNLNNYNVKYASHGTYQVKLKVVADSGCVDSIIKPVVVHPMPNLNFTTSNICFGATNNFNNNSTIQLGNISYTWYFGDGNTGNNVSPTHFYTYADTFTVKLHGVSNQGCQDTLFKQVIVNPFPVVNFTTANVCNGDSVLLNNLTTIDKGGFTTTWNLGNGIDTTAYTFNYLYNNAGYYQIKLKVVADAGCADSVSKGVTVYPVASLNITSADASCNGVSNGNINVTALGGSAPYVYSINNGLTYQSNPLFAALSPGTYNVKTIDVNGCESVFAANPVNINQPNPVAISVLNVKNVNCKDGNDGEIITAGSGGTFPYDFSINGLAYQISNQFSNLVAGTYNITIRDANLCNDSINVVINEPQTGISATVGFSNIKCKNDSTGSITINAAGSVGGYVYSINGGQTFVPNNVFTGLGAGSYNIEVVDSNNCSITNGVTLTEPATNVVLQVTKVVDVTCFGEATGEINALAVGGVGAINYGLNSKQNMSLIPVFTNLTQGSNTLYARDFNGCFDSVQVSISQPSSYVNIDTVLTSNITCFGAANGMVEILASGGTPGYTYQLNNGFPTISNQINVSKGGIITVSVIDSNLCVITDSVTITEPSLLEVDVVSIRNEYCENDSTAAVILDGVGGVGGYQFGFSPQTVMPVDSITGLTNGTYTIVVVDLNNCVGQTNITIGSDNLLPQSAFNYFVSGSVVAFNNASVDADNYFWQFGDGKNSTLQNPVHQYAGKGMYMVELTSENQCGTDTLKQLIDVNSVGIEIIDNKEIVNIYPNPASEYVQVKLSAQLSEEVEISLLNELGQVVTKQIIAQPGSNHIIGVNHLPAGVYLLEIKGDTINKFEKLNIGL